MSMFRDDGGPPLQAAPVELSIDSSVDGGRATLVLTGELDMATARRLEAAVQASLDREGHELVVDLRAVCFMDSTGLRAILRARRDCEQAERDFFLVPAADRGHRRLFQISGLIGYLTFREPDGGQPAQ